MTQPDPDAQATWRAAVTLNLLLLAAMSLGFIAIRVPLSSALAIARFVQMAFSVAWLVVLMREREHPRVGVARVAFASAALPQILVYRLLAVAQQAAGFGWEPFLRQKWLFVVLGVIGPGKSWVSELVIGVFSVDVCLEYWVRGLGASHLLLPHEPWLTLSCAVWGIWIARSRAKQISRERTLRQQLRDATEAARMAQLALAVGDLANTPLQVIELQLTLLEERHQPIPPEAARIRRALTRLEGLSGILATYEPRGQWRRSDASFESFDAAEVLRHARQPRKP